MKVNESLFIILGMALLQICYVLEYRNQKFWCVQRCIDSGFITASQLSVSDRKGPGDFHAW